MIKEKLRYFTSRNELLATIVLANLIGSYYGFFVYYKDQLLAEAIQFWIFIPDSPLATLLAAISISLYIIGRNNNLINILAIFANIKYGLWTVIMMLSYPEGFLQMNPVEMNIFIFLTHLAMSLQALMIWTYTETPKITEITLVSLYFILNDTVDYLYQVYPGLPVEQQLLGYSHAVETILTLAIISYFAKKYLNKKEEGIRGD